MVRSPWTRFQIKKLGRRRATRRLHHRRSPAGSARRRRHPGPLRRSKRTPHRQRWHRNCRTPAVPRPGRSATPMPRFRRSLSEFSMYQPPMSTRTSAFRSTTTNSPAPWAGHSPPGAGSTRDRYAVAYCSAPTPATTRSRYRPMRTRTRAAREQTGHYHACSAVSHPAIRRPTRKLTSAAALPTSSRRELRGEGGRPGYRLPGNAKWPAPEGTGHPAASQTSEVSFREPSFSLRLRPRCRPPRQRCWRGRRHCQPRPAHQHPSWRSWRATPGRRHQPCCRPKRCPA